MTEHHQVRGVEQGALRAQNSVCNQRGQKAGHIDKTAATSVVGAYGGLVYMACLLASLVADRILGPESTLFYSANLVMLGHIALACIPDVTGLASGFLLSSYASRRCAAERESAMTAGPHTPPDKATVDSIPSSLA